MSTVEHWVDHLERLVYFLSDFRTSQDNLAADKNEEHNLRLDHAIDLENRTVSIRRTERRRHRLGTILAGAYKTREELRLVRTEVVMTRRKAFKTDGKLDIARAHNVLDLEISKFGVKTKLLDDSCVFTRRQARVLDRGVSRHKA